MVKEMPKVAHIYNSSEGLALEQRKDFVMGSGFQKQIKTSCVQTGELYFTEGFFYNFVSTSQSRFNCHLPESSCVNFKAHLLCKVKLQ